MDLSNNRLGLAEAVKLKKKKQLNKSHILKSFQNNLKQGKLVILKENTKNIKQNKN